MITPTTDWIPAFREVPDDEVTVLIAIPGRHEEPVTLGYRDAGIWRTTQDKPLTVTHWMHLPEAP